MAVQRVQSRQGQSEEDKTETSDQVSQVLNPELPLNQSGNIRKASVLHRVQWYVKIYHRMNCYTQKISAIFCVHVCFFNVLLRQDQESYQQDHQEVCFSEFWTEWVLCCLSQRGPFQPGPAAGYVGSGGGRLGHAESCHRASFSTESKTAQNTRPHWILCRLGLHSQPFSSCCQTGSVIKKFELNIYLHIHSLERWLLKRCFVRFCWCRCVKIFVLRLLNFTVCRRKRKLTKRLRREEDWRTSWGSSVGWLMLSLPRRWLWGKRSLPCRWGRFYYMVWRWFVGQIPTTVLCSLLSGQVAAADSWAGAEVGHIGVGDWRTWTAGGPQWPTARLCRQSCRFILSVYVL